jgi:Protein of unknown function (DUF429)
MKRVRPGTLVGSYMASNFSAVAALTGSTRGPSGGPDGSVRRDLLYREWARIVALLEREIEGVAAALTTLEPGASGLKIKAYEDALDAVVCAWVAVCALEGRAVAFGDDSAAIWIPSAGGGGLASKFRRC